ncbi:MAG: cupin domain-containing protein [Nocardioidaceae bacterium]
MSDTESLVDRDGNPISLAPVGQELLFENDHVRVWEIMLDAGASQPWHRHRNPYLVIGLEAADNRIDSIEGGEPRLVREEAGSVVYREPGEVHMLTNHGTTRYRSHLVELKCLGEQRSEGRDDA